MLMAMDAFAAKKIGFPEDDGNPIIVAEDSRRHPAGIPVRCAYLKT
jgi:hypothetical protein